MKYFENSYKNQQERILVTAIGSFSAEHVISTLKSDSHFVAGCDIYPREWIANSRLTDHFRRAPLCSNKEEYITFLLKYCNDFGINYIIPLIDPEVDLLSELSDYFEKKGIIICTPSAVAVQKIRNKFNFQRIVAELLSKQRFENIFSIPTYLISDIPDYIPLPVVLKPIQGRSSIGKQIVEDRDYLLSIKSKAAYNDYIVQPMVQGPIVTIDAIRDEFGNTAFMSRRELLRTVSGAGISIETIPDCPAENFCSALLEELEVVGCVNVEFIENILPSGEVSYHILEINPRFSGGIEFSSMAGYNFVSEYLKIYTAKAHGEKGKIEKRKAPCTGKIIARSYTAYEMK